MPRSIPPPYEGPLPLYDIDQVCSGDPIPLYDLDEIFAILDLEESEDSVDPPRPLLSTPPPLLSTTCPLVSTPPRASGSIRPRPSPPSTPSRLYRFESPTVSGYTTAWLRLKLKVCLALEFETWPSLLAKPKKSGKKGSYAVFHGLRPGAYTTWAEARLSVDGVRNNIHQGYGSFQAAQAAIEYAEARSWTRRISPGSSSTPAAGTTIPNLPLPVDLLHGPNPLHSDGRASFDGTWYIVYRGITPGIYQSYLECALNTLGLSNATYDSAPSREEAVRRYENALAGGRVEVITPAYH
ncbi:hypothetical protein B0H11DRAFT_2238322 [Mycena galericulata]|nr:hypothetical protein B0H11DRAFT_2238322 [Mycena galericulata]